MTKTFSQLPAATPTGASVFAFDATSGGATSKCTMTALQTAVVTTAAVDAALPADVAQTDAANTFTVGGQAFQDAGGTVVLLANGNSSIVLTAGAGRARLRSDTGGAAIGDGAAAATAANGVGLAAASQITWSATANWYDAPDCTLSRIATGVLGGGSWVQQTPGEAALAAAFTDAVGTLIATNLSVTLKAGRSYRIEGYLIVSNSTATDGSQFDFGGGSATATTFDVALLNVGTVAAGTVVANSLTGVLNYTQNTGVDRIYVRGYIKVNAAGTVILRAATNTHVAGTMTLAAGSWLAFRDTVPL